MENTGILGTVLERIKCKSKAMFIFTNETN